MPDKKAEVFTDRREFLLATTGDKRKAWKAELICDDGDIVGVYYGLASTEHQFNQEVGDRVLSTTRLTREKLHEEMRAELAAD